ncbi:hypothetical protein [Streptomyces sp. 5-6(2022)]|uniref:hypothetical protein n=1 Tax=Streptomyces sp. 5-6(2022) TaxID=2936510 RepID=UPI0023B97EA9|nr:hypothetical protein [Streptomyces sp. 5-6(2022)]
MWSDDGSTCDGVASYYTHDGDDIDTSHHTPLEAIRALIERHWRDPAADDGDADHLAARRHGLELLREALTRLETGDRDETGAGYVRAYDGAAGPADPARVATLDGAGALVSGETAPERPVQPGLRPRPVQGRSPLLRAGHPRHRTAHAPPPRPHDSPRPGPGRHGAEPRAPCPISASTPPLPGRTVEV